MATDTTPITDPVYRAPAEVFGVQRNGRKRTLFYRRFDSAAEAVRFISEDLDASVANVSLETSRGRLDAAGIARLYEAEGFPLPRRAAAA